MPVKNTKIKKNPADFSKYLKEKLEQFHMKVPELAKDLNIAEKTIYRYLDAQYYPRSYIEGDIRSYFHHKELEMQEREGYCYAEGEIVKDPEVMAEMERQYLEWEKEYLDEEYNSDSNDLVRYRDEYIEKMFQWIEEGIRQYNDETQEYIADIFDAICMLEDEDMELVEKVGGMDKSGSGKVFAYLESIPVSFGMITRDCEENTWKMGRYVEILRIDPEDIPANKMRKIRVNSKKPPVKKEISDRLYSAIQWVTWNGAGVPGDILNRLKTVLDYSRQDWYLLFLYERMKNQDRYDGTYAKGEKNIGILEEMFDTFLEFTERRSR